MNVQAREEFHYLFSIPSQAQPRSWFSGFRALLGRFPVACFSTSADPESYLKTAGALVGFSNINTLALPFLLKDVYHVSPAGLGLMGALIAAPVFLKPAFALTQTAGNRRSFLMLAAGGDFLTRVGIGLLPADGSQIYALGSLLLLGSTAVALDGITRDTLLIETLSGGGSGGSQPLTGVTSDGPTAGDGVTSDLIADVSGLASLTALSVAYLSGYLLQFTTPGHLILGSAAIPALAVLNAWRLQEQPASTVAAATASASGVSVALQQPATTMKLEQMWSMLQASPVLQSQLGACTISALAPTFQDAMFYFYTDQLKLQPEFFGRWRLVGNLASLCSNGLYRAFFKDVDQKNLAIYSQALIIPIIGSVLFVTTGTTEKFFGLSAPTFIIARHALFDGLNTLAAIPNTVMLARVAPRGREGMFFAVYGLINDSTNVINGAVSSATTLAFGIRNGNFANITNLIMFSSALQVLVAPWTLWTPESVPPVAPEELRELEEVPASSSGAGPLTS